MKVAKVLFLYFVFCAEVRVVAAEMLVSLPKGCWNHEFPCAIKNIDTKKKAVKFFETTIHLGPQAIVTVANKKNVRIVDGKVFAKGSGGAEWNSVFGSWRCLNSCKIIVEKNETNLRILALEGDLTVRRLGDAKSYNLPSGFWVVLSEVGSDGKGLMEFPQSLPIQSTLKEFSELYVGTWQEFRKEARRLVSSWSKAAEVASRWHQIEAKRDIAAYHAEQARLLDERRKAQAEDLHLRSIFRSQNYMNE